MSVKKKCAGTAAAMALAAFFGGCIVQSPNLSKPKPISPRPTENYPHKTRPNFVTIVLDDLGFSDLGVFGSEIPTPNMDQLAKEGIMLTNFYAAPTSTPSRAMLFTGKDSHAAGVGIMASMKPKPEQQGKREYQGRLALDVPAFPELLQQNGYYTMFTGKWDLAGNPYIFEAYRDAKDPTKLKPTVPFAPADLASLQQQIQEIREHDPIRRGFSVTRAALVPGGGYHYSGAYIKDKNGKYTKAWELNNVPWELQSPIIMPDLLYTENGAGIKAFAKEFYSTDYYTDMGIDMLRNRDKRKPFYLCLTYTAPHNPLQAPKDVVASYANFYSKGWDEIRKKRFERQKQLGLWPQDAKLPSLSSLPGAKTWNDLSKEERQKSAKEMAVYAAMIDVLDRNIGRLVRYLKEINEYDNTMIFLYSDNGGGFVPINTSQEIPVDNSYENIGNPNSYVGVDGRPEWATAMNAPFASYKGSTNEGGWHTAALLHYPNAKAAGVKSGRVVSVMDIAPTILEMADIKYPVDYKGKLNEPMSGVSMADMLKGRPSGHADRFVAFEMNGKIGVRSGDWKLVKECQGGVKLFDLKNDPFEQKDLAADKLHQDKLRQLKDIYNQYAAEHKIVSLSSCKPL